MNSLPKIKGTYKKNFPLSKLTWFQTGGKAKVLFVPKNLLDLQFFLKNIMFYILSCLCFQVLRFTEC